MTKSKLERLVDYATELCGEEDAPGYLAQALGASILKTCQDYSSVEGTTYECIRETLTLVDIDNKTMSVYILAALIGRIIYESPMNVKHVKERMHDPALASIRGALNIKVTDNV